MKRKEITNIWGWLDEITLKKSPVSSFTEKEWDIWNSYMVHRFLSMNKNYLEVANAAQKFSPQDKSQIYSFYKEFIPRKKTWSKYIKSQVKQPNKELIETLASYFEVSKREVISYLDILDKKEITRILNTLGIEDKEAKKLLK